MNALLLVGTELLLIFFMHFKLVCIFEKLNVASKTSVNNSKALPKANK